MTANQVGPVDSPDQVTTDQATTNQVNDEKTCSTKIVEFFRDKGIVILGIFISLGTVQDSSRSSFQCLIKKL